MNILITGAAKRVGANCARLLHQEGHRLFLHYRSSASQAGALCQELNAMRADSAYLLQADLLSLQSLKEMVAQLLAKTDGVDVLINNASAFYETPFLSTTEEQWEELLGSNLKAPFFLTQALTPILQARKGVVINLLDVHAERGKQDYAAYCIAKAGLAAMTRFLAKELAPEVRVNGVAPGAILWPEQDLPENEKQQILAKVALQRNGMPDDIAKAVRYLILDAEYVTGQILTVDGGRSLFS